MSVIAAAIKHMLAAGMEHDAIVAAVAEMEAACPKGDPVAERRRAYDRERKARKAAEFRVSGGIPVESAETTPPSLNDPQHSSSTLESSLNPPPQKTPKGVQKPPLDWPKAGFAEFYAAYPRKQGRKDAQRAWERIGRSGGVAFAEIMAGLKRYVASEPDPQFVPHPATWLNGERWSDDHDAAPRRQATGPPPRKPSVQDIALGIAEEARRNEHRHEMYREGSGGIGDGPYGLLPAR